MYIAIFLVILYMTVMYRWAPGLVILVVELGLWLMSHLYLSLAAKNVTGYLGSDRNVVTCHEPMELQVMLVNSGRLPLFRVDADLPNLPAYMKFSLNGKQRAGKVMTLRPKYSGVLELSMPCLRIFGLGRMCSKKIKLSESYKIYVLPQIMEIPVILKHPPMINYGESELYDPYMRGEDASEIIGIREYLPGDSLKRIHWKASARAGELMVKDYGKPICIDTVLLMDLFTQSREKPGAVKNRLLTLTLSVAHGMILAGCPFYFGWFDNELQQLQRIEIMSEEDLYDWYIPILEAPIYEEPVDLWELYQEKYGHEQAGTIICINERMVIRTKDGSENFSEETIIYCN